MGKKSKRSRGNAVAATTTSGGAVPPVQQQQHQQQQQPSRKKVATGSTNPSSTRAEEEEETKETLKFEDPFVDELIIEEEEDQDDDNDDDDEDEYEGEDEDDDDDEDHRGGGTTVPSNDGDGGVEVIQSWHPLMGATHGGEMQDATTELELDPSAYKMYHTLQAGWPCLSFDILRDDLGDGRQRFPHSIQAVVGTQADTPEHNQLTVIKLSDLSKLPQDKDDDDDEDVLGDEYDKDDDKSDDDDSDDDDDDVDLDPILEHYSVPHYGGVNRVRAMPQQNSIVATWSDVGKVYLFDVSDLQRRFEVSEGRGGGSNNAATTTATNKAKHSANNTNGPFFTYGGHSTEGFALDWSTVQKGQLASGDNEGNIHIWTAEHSSDGGGGSSYYTVRPSYETPAHCSIEDLQWSPTEATVLCAAESGGHVAVYDTRAPHKAMLRPCIQRGGVDINVLSWNRLVSNLLATGSDDGTLCVWDLRHFGGGGGSGGSGGSGSGGGERGGGNKAPEPLARFACHKTPITSVEWHPTDESMLAMSDEVGVYIYDLSVEEDEKQQPSSSSTTTMLAADIPPQLLFCHSGSNQFKECHWHPQISSCIMTTAYSGFSVFIPSNL